MPTYCETQYSVGLPPKIAAFSFYRTKLQLTVVHSPLAASHRAKRSQKVGRNSRTTALSPFTQLANTVLGGRSFGCYTRQRPSAVMRASARQGVRVELAPRVRRSYRSLRELVSPSATTAFGGIPQGRGRSPRTLWDKRRGHVVSDGCKH